MPLLLQKYSLSKLAGVLLLFVFPFFGGCSFAPDYARPQTALPEQFVMAGEKAVQEGAEANRAWWVLFNSKALPSLQELAIAQNHNFAANRWSLAQSLVQVRSSRSSLFPSIGASGGVSRRGSENASGSYQVTDAYNGTLQASYELDIWGKNRNTLASKEYQALASLNAWRGAGLSLESEVALTYFSYLATKEYLNIYTSMLANAKEVLAYLEVREQYGAISPLDVVRQRSSVQSMEAEKVSYQHQLKDAYADLCLLVGRDTLPEDIEAQIKSERMTSLVAPSVAVGLPSDLLIRRPDIAEAESRLQAANADIGVARAAFLPSLNLSASAGWQSDHLSNLFTPANAFYSLGASLAQTIFQGGKLVAQHDISIAAKNQLIESYRQAVLAGFLEVNVAVDACTSLTSQEQFRHKSAGDAAEAYRIARARYEKGAEDFLAVLNAQDTVLSSDNALVRIRLERLNSAVSLFKALGGGWSDEGDVDELGKVKAIK